MATVNDRAGMVRRAARAFALIEARDPFGHRKLTDEARAGNPYVLAKLAARGLTYDTTIGAIVRRDQGTGR
jgi:hypothetical protein